MPLPHDVFYAYILPDLLSDHLHRLLVTEQVIDWHPFFVLPLVSPAFNATCHALCIKIFGLEHGEDGSVIDQVLTYAQELWAQALQPPMRAQPVTEYTFGQLMSSKSLIQVYMCTALARSFLNLDVLWNIELQAQYGNEEPEEHEMDVDEPSRRRFKMRDDTMHRVYLPLTCAMKLCDFIRPDRLAYVAADYLAGIVPIYSTAPVMLKYTQDLETYVAREHRVDMETWVTWTCQTLGLIEDTHQLLRQMQNQGKLVRSFKRDTCVPQNVISATNIIKVLQDVVDADWGPHSEEIRERAQNLLYEWTPEE